MQCNVMYPIRVCADSSVGTVITAKSHEVLVGVPMADTVRVKSPVERAGFGRQFAPCGWMMQGIFSHGFNACR